MDQNEKNSIFDTPMMKQHQEMKNSYPDTVLFFRMGDFYEMFFDDAFIATKVLQIALTERQKGVPMAGIPFHALDNYLKKMVRAGYKVAICEQMESKPEKGQKVVHREVTRVITPGTFVEEGPYGKFLISAYIGKLEVSAVVCDFGTGESFLFLKKNNQHGQFRDTLEIFFRTLLSHYGKSEFLLHGKDFISEIEELLRNEGVIVNLATGQFGLNEWVYDNSFSSRMIREHFGVISAESILGKVSQEFSSAQKALGALLFYIKETQKGILGHLRVPRYMPFDEIMYLDESVVRALELIRNQTDDGVKGSLLHTLDQCVSVLGKRKLKQSLLAPLIQIDEIEKRLDLVGYFLNDDKLRKKIRNILQGIFDLEKGLGKVCAHRAVPADLGNLRATFRSSLELLEILDLHPEPYLKNNLPSKKSLTLVLSLQENLNTRLSEKLPYNFEGQYIKEGFSEKIDRLRTISQNGRDWIIQYQNALKEETGINNLKIKYNRIFGYFIEISKGQASQAPAHFLRKQTLVNAERYTTDKLKEYERDLLEAEEGLALEERKIFNQLMDEIIAGAASVQEFSDFLGYLDMYVGLAEKARQANYTRPKINSSRLLRIVGGRHPVVEEAMPPGNFIPNDLVLDGGENCIGIVTGPNMAGKSTFIRQIALLVLMAQMGSFVPANEAVIGLCDRIFTRIGSGDNLARGQSTFLLEMQEAANILHNFSSRSLLIFDEIGRGTSTYDGMSIAWSLIEFLGAQDFRPRTLFATHYHELTALSKKKGIFNLTLLVEETEHSVNFLRKVVPGATDRSYGVHVAKLAGIPASIIRRSFQILKTLEEKGKKDNQLQIFHDFSMDDNVLSENQNASDLPSEMKNNELPIFFNEMDIKLDEPDLLKEILADLRELEVDEMTPREALDLIFSWKEKTRRMKLDKKID